MSVDEVLFKSYSKHYWQYWVIAAQKPSLKLIMVQSIAKIEGVDVLVLTQVGSDVSIPTAGLIIAEMLSRQEKRKDESMFYLSSAPFPNGLIRSGCSSNHHRACIHFSVCVADMVRHSGNLMEAVSLSVTEKWFGYF